MDIDAIGQRYTWPSNFEAYTPELSTDIEATGLCYTPDNNLRPDPQSLIFNTPLELPLKLSDPLKKQPIDWAPHK